jgi:hypothetical protein
MPVRRVIFAAVCAVSLVGCEAGINSPVSPSAGSGGSSALNADGSNLKVSAPLPLSPLADATGVATTPELAAREAIGRYLSGATLSHRFQVSDDDAFANIVSQGAGAVDTGGIARYTVGSALATGKKHYWRVRAELGDAYGPWSNAQSFTTTGTVTAPTPTFTPGNLPRTADPPAGQRLPLPNMFHIVQQHANTSDSCPRGIQYVNNPWQDRVIDALRQTDSRWGYNGKPTRTAAQNGGVPVVAAGDEAAYHWGPGPDQGSFDVHLVDMLIGHCGPNPSIGWRVFTGEEPGFWTGAGRF